MTCSICNCEVTLPALTVIFGTKDRAVYAGHLIHMTPREAEITAVLINKHGAFASVIDIMRGMYGARWIDYEQDNVPNLVSRVRHKLRTVGIEIVTVNKVGYALRLKNGCACARSSLVSRAGRGQHKNRPVRYWTDERLRPIAELLTRGYSHAAAGAELGSTKAAITGAIRRNSQRIKELSAHEARQSMGGRS